MPRVMLKSLGKTVELRMPLRQADAAQRIAEPLEGRAGAGGGRPVPRPCQPSQRALGRAADGAGGTVIALDLTGGQEAAFRFLNALEIITISQHLGRCEIDHHPTPPPTTSPAARP